MDVMTSTLVTWIIVIYIYYQYLKATTKNTPKQNARAVLRYCMVFIIFAMSTEIFAYMLNPTNTSPTPINRYINLNITKTLNSTT